MALLNPPDIIPEAMRFLVRAVLAVSGKEIERSDLVSMVAPGGLIEAMEAMGRDTEPAAGDDSDLRTGGTVIADKSLDALRMLGIVRLDAQQVSLAEVPAGWTKPTDVDAVSFSRLLLQRVIATAKPGAEHGDSQGPMDLVQSLVVLHIANDPMWPFATFESARRDTTRDFMNEQRMHFGDDRTRWPVPNREQWQSLRRWGPYLGLARSVGSDGLIPDASTALTRQLSLPPGEYEIGQFVTACAHDIPLLDGGTLHFGHDSRDSGEHSVLSPGLSVSLLQLEAGGCVAFSRLSDIGARTIRTAPDGSADQVVSHVKWTGAGSSRKVRS